jgi:hypothetical protein
VVCYRSLLIVSSYDHQKLGWFIAEASQPEALSSSGVKGAAGILVCFFSLLLL